MAEEAICVCGGKWKWSGGARDDYASVIISHRKWAPQKRPVIAHIKALVMVDQIYFVNPLLILILFFIHFFHVLFLCGTLYLTLLLLLPLYSLLNDNCLVLSGCA